MQPLSLASRNLLFREYGSVFLTPGVLKNDQKVVVQERRQRWMTGILSPCLDVRGLTQQELQTSNSFMQLVSLSVNRQSEIVFMTTEFMLGDQP